MHRRIALLALASACRGDPAAPAVPPANRPPPPPFALWRADLKATPIALAGGSLMAWDQDRDGIVELSAQTGHEQRFRAIAGLNINGVPDLWHPIPGGYLARWDELTSIRDHAGALSRTWVAGGDWWGSWVIDGDTVWGARGREDSSFVALGLLDGKPRWTVKFPPDAQDAVVAGDATTLVYGRQRYLKLPPGEHDIHRVLGGLEAATGAQLWTIELPYEPGEIAFGSGGIALATEAPQLVLYDARSGRATTLPLHDRYPRLLVTAGVAYVADRDDNTIAAYRIADGRLLWRTSHAVGNGTNPQLHGRLFVIGTEYGSVLALDRTTGAEQWDVGTGIVHGKVFVDDTAVISATDALAIGFAPPAAPPEPERATIHGHVRSVACAPHETPTLRVGNQSVTADQGGNFRAEVRAVGVVLVAGPGSFDDNAAHQSSVTIRLTGAGDYTTPELELGMCPRD